MKNQPPRQRGTRKGTIMKRRSAASPRMVGVLKRLVAGCVVIGLVAWVWTTAQREEWGRHAAQKIHNSFVQASLATGWKLEKVQVVGLNRVTQGQLQQALMVNAGDPLLFYDVNSAAQRVAQIGWVKSVQLTRKLPNILQVTLVERVPVALWRQASGRIQVIDREGVVVSPIVTPAFKDLLVIQGDDAADNVGTLLTALHDAPQVFQRLDQGQWVGDRRWDLMLKNGIVLKLPADDMATALQRISAAQLRDDILNKPLEYVDVRDAQRVIIKPKSGQAGDLPLSLVSGKQDPV